MANFHDFKIDTINGDTQSLSDYSNNVVLVINVASECGLTPQYSGLEKMYREFKEQGFVVLGLPCNQFGAQEPGDEAKIKEFCSVNYDVTFPMGSKIEVNGENRHPLYSWLTSEENGFAGDITWNFEKFLINKDGSLIKRYGPKTPPEDSQLRNDITSAL
ncbi:MAG: glutathione peroxidase [Gammaproteobacteria bacterium]|nr:glutathione peroxidase [Gammaproteobacteria bacterium]